MYELHKRYDKVLHDKALHDFAYQQYLLENCYFCSITQGTFHALRPEYLRHGVSFPVGLAAWILPKLFPLAYWRRKMQISIHSSFDLCASGVRQLSTLMYTSGATGVTPARVLHGMHPGL